jgi:hypothetical protein
MYSLTIAFGETPAMWRLLFKTEEAACIAQSVVTGEAGSFVITDDFGQTCGFKASDIVGHMLEDLDQSKLAGVEMMLHNARTQAAAQTIARTEPALRAVGQQGPSVFVPNGGGRMG